MDDEIPNDEQINEMIARSDNELIVFDRMDNERYIRDKEQYQNIERVSHYRLI